MSTPQINRRLARPILGSLIVHACLFLAVAFLVKSDSKSSSVYRVIVMPAKVSPPPKTGIQSKTFAPVQPAPVIASNAKESLPFSPVMPAHGAQPAKEEIQGYNADLSEPATPGNMVDAVYTSRAHGQGIEGDVVLDVTVGSDGRVQSAEIIKHLGYGLDQSALSAILKSTFLAAKDSNGNATNSRVIYTYKFRFENLRP